MPPETQRLDLEAVPSLGGVRCRKFHTRPDPTLDVGSNPQKSWDSTQSQVEFLDFGLEFDLTRWW